MELKQVFLMACFSCSVLIGCKTSPDNVVTPQPVENKFTLPDSPLPLLDVATPDSLFILDEHQKTAFLNYFHDEKNQSVPANERLYQYLEQLLDGFHFQGQTYTASQALEQQTGNCLSLAILTTALARLVDLEFSYQRVNSAPVYHRYHNVMTLSSHVRTHLYRPMVEKKDNVITVRRPTLIIDYFPQSGNVTGDKVGYDDFLAMYYQNLAGDALVKEDYQQAFSFLYEGWRISPDNPETLNTLAVLFNKTGHSTEAEKLYRYALDKEMGSVNTLSNYHLLLEQQGRIDEAKELELHLERIDDDNPYRWFDIANRQYRKANYSIAMKYYKRALEEAPYLHEGHFGIAKVYYSLGDEKQARLALNRALELTYIPEEQRLYQSKLKVLEATQTK